MTVDIEPAGLGSAADHAHELAADREEHAAAMAIASGMIQVAAIKKQQQASEAQGYSEGGFTRPGRRDEPAGVVHAGEWVASQKLVNNPKTRPLLEALAAAGYPVISAEPVTVGGSTSAGSPLPAIRITTEIYLGA